MVGVQGVGIGAYRADGIGEGGGSCTVCAARFAARAGIANNYRMSDGTGGQT